MEYVLKAEDALYNKREAEDVLRDLRAARDSFKTFFDANETKIAEIIDSGSKGESDQKPKSKRIKEIYDKIAYFLNIGPHNDKYEVTYADAQLAFRQFVPCSSSVLSVTTTIFRLCLTFIYFTLLESPQSSFTCVKTSERYESTETN